MRRLDRRVGPHCFVATKDWVRHRRKWCAKDGAFYAQAFAGHGLADACGGSVHELTNVWSGRRFKRRPMLSGLLGAHVATIAPNLRLWEGNAVRRKGPRRQSENRAPTATGSFLVRPND